MTATRIAFFEVAPADDAAFVAAWAPAPAAALHRALRRDAAFRFVAFLEPDASPAHGSVYEAVDEHRESGGAGGVLLVAPYVVEAGEEADFPAGWARLRDAPAPRQGYLGARLHRSVGPAVFGFVAVVRWSSPLMYARALQDAAIQAEVGALPGGGREAMYLPAG
jgi:hypothetical protein